MVRWRSIISAELHPCLGSHSLSGLNSRPITSKDRPCQWVTFVPVTKTKHCKTGRKQKQTDTKIITSLREEEHDGAKRAWETVEAGFVVAFLTFAIFSWIILFPGAVFSRWRRRRRIPTFDFDWKQRSHSRQVNVYLSRAHNTKWQIVRWDYGKFWFFHCRVTTGDLLSLEDWEFIILKTCRSSYSLPYVSPPSTLSSRVGYQSGLKTYHSPLIVPP